MGRGVGTGRRSGKQREVEREAGEEGSDNKGEEEGSDNKEKAKKAKSSRETQPANVLACRMHVLFGLLCSQVLVFWCECFRVRV